jgi:hypothetical protein
MTEIDPWAMPQATAVNPGSVGLPGSIYEPTQRLRPLDRRLPRVVTGLGVLYMIVSIVEIFSIDHAATTAQQLNSLITANQFPTLAQSAQLQSDENAVATVSWIALIVFLAVLVTIGAWQRSLGEALGSVGARRAVFGRAGYRYLRLAWVLTLLFSLFLQATTTNGYVNSYADAVDHDHTYMLYCAVRAALGAVVVYFAARLRRVSEEAVGLLNGTYVPD